MNETVPVSWFKVYVKPAVNSGNTTSSSSHPTKTNVRASMVILFNLLIIFFMTFRLFFTYNYCWYTFT